MSAKKDFTEVGFTTKMDFSEKIEGARKEGVSKKLEKSGKLMKLLKPVNSEKKYLFWFMLLLLLGTSVRLFGLGQPIFDDETNYVESVSNPGPYYTINPFFIHQHPPLGGWFYFFFGNVFGQNEAVYRLVPLFLWVINMFLLFFMVRREYSAKAAFFSSILFGASYYSMLMSLQIDIEGSLLVTTFLLIAIGYIQYGRTRSAYWLLFTGFSFGLALLTKTTAILFLGAIGLHAFLSAPVNTSSGTMPSTTLRAPLSSRFSYFSLLSSSFLLRFRYSVIVFLSVLSLGLAVFSFFPLLMWDLFQQMMGHSSEYLGFTISWMAIAMLFFWATPLLVGLFFLQALQFRQQDRFWVIWSGVMFVLYTFFILGRPGTHGAVGGVADYSRHFMNLMVPFSVLGGVFLSRLQFNAKKKSVGTGIFFSALVLFFFVNFKTTRILPRNFLVYLDALKNLDFNFLFSFTTSSGNLLGVNMGVMVLAIAVSFILLLFIVAFSYGLVAHSSMVLGKRIQAARWLFVIFLSLGAALNVFLVVEYLGPITSPDTNTIFLELVQ